MRDLLDAMTAIEAAVFTMDGGDSAPKFETTDPAQAEMIRVLMQGKMTSANGVYTVTWIDGPQD
ncbi:MAG: hypothetical protein WBF49_08285 [Methyloceanibacter sp.]|jgi:hypothetical protein